MSPPGADPGAPRRRLSAGLQAFLVLSSFAVVPTAVFGAIEADDRGRRLLERFDADAAHEAAAVTDLLRHVLLGKAAVLEAAARTLGALPTWDPALLQAMLDARAASGDFDGVYVTDETGHSVAFAPLRRADGSAAAVGVNYSDRDYYQAALRAGGLGFSRVQRGKQTRVANLMLGVVIPPAGGARPGRPPRGFVGAAMRLDALDRPARERLRRGEQRRLVVVDSHGQVLVDSLDQIDPLAPVPPGSAWAQGCSAPPSGIEAPDERGVPLRLACAELQLGEQRWTVWTGRPRGEILAGVADARRATLGVALLAFVVAVAVSAGLAAMFSRWIGRMRGFADELAGGRLDARPGPLHPLAPAEVAELRAATVRTLDAFSAARGEVDALLVELRAANARLRPLAAAWAEMSDVVEVLDPAGVVRFVNPAWRARAPAGAPDPVGRPSALLSAAAVGGEALADGLLSGRPWHGELPGDDGAPVELLAATPVRGPEGALDVVVIVRRDLRPLRAAQAAATEADRLAAVGALAAGVAHEINNPLTYIRTNLELLTTAAEDPDLMPAEELAALARDATAGVDRVARTVRDLLAVARGGRGAAQEPAQVLELAELARSAAGLGAPQAGPRTRVDVEVPAGLRSEVREGEIVRVLLNLVLNAAQAAGAGGRRGRVALQGGEDGAWVWIDVIDDGPGVPAEIAARIFEPFFTTRAEGQGSGLGLSVSRGIAQDHGGRLELRPGPGGACFRLSLPRAGGAGPPAGVRPPPRPARPIAPGAPPEARVLVVDDDPPVARSIARALRRFGVEVAHSGAEALARLEAHRFVLVVSDVRMPGMSGPELHRRAQSVRCLPFLFVTGGAGEADSRALEATGCEVLPKPLDPRLLVARVEALLDAGG